MGVLRADNEGTGGTFGPNGPAGFPDSSDLSPSRSGWTIMMKLDYTVQSPVITGGTFFVLHNRRDTNVLGGTNGNGHDITAHSGTYMRCHFTETRLQTFTFRGFGLPQRIGGGKNQWGYRDDAYIQMNQFNSSVLQQDDEFVFIIRSGSDGKVGNGSGMSVAVYKKSSYGSDHNWTASNHFGYVTGQNVMGRWAGNNWSMFRSNQNKNGSHQESGNVLFLNGTNLGYIQANLPAAHGGITNGGFEYKSVVMDYKCANDSQIAEFLNTAFNG